MSRFDASELGKLEQHVGNKVSVGKQEQTFNITCMFMSDSQVRTEIDKYRA